METTKVLITGATGLLGNPTVSTFRLQRHMDTLGLGHHELDITDADHVKARFETFRPDLVVNCAAYTKVDDCEANETHARRVNGEGAGNVARAAADCGARLIHLSTDYVFDGEATKPYQEEYPPSDPHKLSAYGRSKLLGEQLVRQHYPAAIIVRSSWLFGPDGPCFPRTILERARNGDSLRVVNDQTGSPTYAPDLAQALCELAQHDASGIFHITNAGQCSWYDFACELLKRARLDVPIEPVSTDAFPRPAKRPMFSVLGNRKYQEATGMVLCRWNETLTKYLS